MSRCVQQKKMFLKISQNSQKNTCGSLFLSMLQAQACNFIKKGPLIQVVSCEFCEIFKDTFLSNSSGRLPLAIPEPLFTATCVPFCYAAENLAVYSMFHRFSSLGSSKICQWLGFFRTHLLCYDIGKSWNFLKSHISKKSFQQNSYQSSVVM